MDHNKEQIFKACILSTISKTAQLMLLMVIYRQQRVCKWSLLHCYISRCKRIEDLVFFPFKNYTRFKKIFTQAIFKDRKRQDEQEALSDQNFGLLE